MVQVWTVGAADQIAARLDADLHRHATPDVIAARLWELLAADERDWVRIDALVDLGDEMGRDMPDGLHEDLDAARAEDHGVLDMTEDCLVCAWNPAECALSVLFCRLPVDLTPVGDAASVARELRHYAVGTEMDVPDLALSLVGLFAVAVAPLTGGTSVTVKIGAGVLKFAYRVGGISAELLAEVRAVLARAIDSDAARNAGVVAVLTDLRRYLDLDSLAPLGRLAQNAGAMQAAVGLPRSVFILRSATSEADVRRLAAVATASPRKTAGALELLGKNRLVRTSMRWSDEVLQVIRGLVGLVAACLLLMLSTLKTILLRALRRAAR